ncbi:16S rRNA (guanine(527)-N(7))-methyltransferase RsmG [Galenea microaerophila]
MQQLFSDKLEQASEQLGIALSPQQQAQLLQYLALLQKWNQTYNLTAIREPEEMLVKHIIDSLTVVPHLQFERMIDVGTGGGLPGVVLAIMFPEKQVDMLDSNHKKTRFLVQAKGVLGLQNSQIHHCRVETYQPEILYDGIISRAFARIEEMVHWTQHLLAKEGFWWAMKGQKETEDLTQLEGVEVVQVIPLKVPFLSAERTLIQLKEKTHG